MNIRNATIAMRKRKGELLEQERVASMDADVQRRGGVHGESKKKNATHKKAGNPSQQASKH